MNFPFNEIVHHGDLCLGQSVISDIIEPEYDAIAWDILLDGICCLCNARLLCERTRCDQETCQENCYNCLPARSGHVLEVSYHVSKKSQSVLNHGNVLELPCPIIIASCIVVSAANPPMILRVYFNCLLLSWAGSSCHRRKRMQRAKLAD